jgi:Na+-translocating ferredoxin:NAD+ oxidoreductase RnfG subunit
MELSDIEAISGATITSEAVVEAINNAYKELASGEAEPEEETPAAEEPKAEEPEAEEPAGEAVKGTGDGYGGDVNVEAVFSEDGEIKSLKIDEEDFMETAGIGTRVLEEESFINSFIGKKAPIKIDDIEAVSGATITSEAVVDAVNDAFEKASAEPAGEAVKGTGDGYGGDVNVEAVFSEDGEIKSLKIDEEDFMETVGIGTRVLEEESFMNSLIGKKAPIKIDDIEAVSGATITSEAVVDAVNDAFEKAGAETKEEPVAEEPKAEEPAGEAVKGTGDGYGGDVNVEAVFAEDGEIKSLKIDEEDFMETAGIGTRVLEEKSFINSFIGKKAPIKIDDIEAVSGATITSEAVVDAVNDAFEKAGAESEAEEPAAETKEEEPETEPAGEAVKGTGDGYGGDVNVEAVFSEDGEIKSLKIDEEDFMETAGIGTRVLEEESFINSFIGKKAPIKIDDIEAVSGATITSEAVVDAVNDAFEKASAEPAAEEPAAEAKEEEPEAEEPAGEAVKGTGDGYGGDVNVEAVFSEDGEIKSLKIDEEDFMETAGIGTRVLEEESFINSFIGKKAPIKIDDIEAVSGATITSEAVVDAVNDAFEKIGSEPEAEEPAAETKEEPAGKAVKGTGDGYGGDVNVEAVFSEDGEIKSLKIDEEDFMETAGIGTRVLEEESFINSFIGKKAPIKIDDIEAVSGATITSEAVVDAVNDAFEKIGSETEAVKGTGDGYGGDVNVEAVFSEDGEIKSLKIDEEDFMETAGIGTRVLEEESFINSFIGKKAPIKIDDIEAVSGATITSEAVVDAVNDAFEKAGAETKKEPVAEEPKAEEPAAQEPAGKAVKGTGDGYGGDVNVEAVFSEDGEIKSLKIDEEDFMETAGIGTRVLEEESFINSFIGKKAPIKIDDIEAVSGATITSEAVVDAVNDAFNNR